MKGEYLNAGVGGTCAHLYRQALDGVDTIDVLAYHAAREGLLRESEEIEFEADRLWGFLLGRECELEGEELARLHLTLGFVNGEVLGLEMPKVVDLHHSQVAHLEGSGCSAS